MLADDPRLPPPRPPAALSHEEAAALAAIVDVGGEIHTVCMKRHLVALQDLRERGLVSYTRGMTVRSTSDGDAALRAYRART